MVAPEAQAVRLSSAEEAGRQGSAEPEAPADRVGAEGRPERLVGLAALGDHCSC